MPTRFLINQCQIITFLILKSDYIENSRIELKGIVLQVRSNQIKRHVPTRFLINQCQIITFLILKSDYIESSRIELKGKVLQVRSNQIKVTSL